MRARNIKPQFFENDQLGECSIAARMLFIGAWCYSDREGRFKYRPKRIAAAVFPYDLIDIEPLIDELEAVKDSNGKPAFLQRYTIDGEVFIQIENFKKHQRPHPREKASIIPPPRQGENKATPRHNLGTTQAMPFPSDVMNDDIRKEDIPTNRGEGQGDKRETKESLPSRSAGDLFPSEEEGKEPSHIQKQKSEEKKDPLEAFPKLARAYPVILETLKSVHPSVKLPLPGSEADLQWRDTLSKLARLDLFTEIEILNSLKFVFKADHPDAVFWRGNIASLAGLRKRTKSGLTKFGAVHEKWKAAQAATVKSEAPKECSPEMMEEARKYRERMAQQEREREAIAAMRAEAKAKEGEAAEAGKGAA